MQRKQFRELRRRAESAPDGADATPATEGAGLPVGQTAPWCAPDATLGHAPAAWIYRRSGGRVLGRMGGRPVLLLHTTGRGSGQTHTAPVEYLTTATGPRGGLQRRRPPSTGLVSQPARRPARPHRCCGRSVDVRAQEATGPERAELWQRLTAANRSLERAARKARHDLPLIHLVTATPKRRSKSPTVRDDDAALTRRFSSDTLADLDEPVRRYFSHAISDGAALSNGVRMAMSGRIKVGVWLPFTAQQERSTGDPSHSSGSGPVAPLYVTDHYADGAGEHRGGPARAREPVCRPRCRHGPIGGDACRDRERRCSRQAQRTARNGVAWRAEHRNIDRGRFDLPADEFRIPGAHLSEHGAIEGGERHALRR